MTQTDTTGDQGTDMVCSEAGVVVRIRSREAHGEVPAFEYVVGSEREVPVAVHLSQAVPEDVAEADIGFPSECEDHWSVIDGALVTDRVLAPDEQFTTVWGVRSDEHPSIEPPSIDVTPVDGEPDILSRHASDADGVSGADASSDEIPDAPAADPSDVRSAATIGPDAEAASLGSDAPAPVATDGSLVEQLVEELESGTVSAEERTALADALEVAASDSANAFVEHVQDKVDRRSDRLADDIASLEESVQQLYGVKADASEIGSLKRGLTDLEERTVTSAELRDLRRRLEEHTESASSERASLRQQIETLSETAAEAENLASLAENVGDLQRTAVSEDEFEALREDLETVQDSVADLREEISTLEEALREDLTTLEDDLRSELDEREAEVRDDFESRADNIQENLSSLADDHGALRGDHAKLQDRAVTTDDLEQLRAEHGAQLNATRSDVAAIEAELEEYTTDSEISEEINHRVQRSVGTLVLFGIGATGLLSTLPLAIDGSRLAVITFLVGAAALYAWWQVLGVVGDPSVGEVSAVGEPGE